MSENKIYENYPGWIPVISILLEVLIYAAGFFILLKWGSLVAITYLIFIILLQINLLKNHCVDCYYYGQTCGLGKGKLSAIFFKKGHPKRFTEREVSWKMVVPDLMVFLIPFTAGVIFLFKKFSLLIMGLIFLLFAFSFWGNALLRGSLLCKFCKQRELGCPAERLFNKKKQPLNWFFCGNYFLFRPPPLNTATSSKFLG